MTVMMAQTESLAFDPIFQDARRRSGATSSRTRAARICYLCINVDYLNVVFSFRTRILYSDIGVTYDVSSALQSMLQNRFVACCLHTL